MELCSSLYAVLLSISERAQVFIHVYLNDVFSEGGGGGGGGRSSLTLMSHTHPLPPPSPPPPPPPPPLLPTATSIASPSTRIQSRRPRDATLGHSSRSVPTTPVVPRPLSEPRPPCNRRRPWRSRGRRRQQPSGRRRGWPRITRTTPAIRGVTRGT